jgi:hypothetical protein
MEVLEEMSDRWVDARPRSGPETGQNTPYLDCPRYLGSGLPAKALYATDSMPQASTEDRSRTTKLQGSR